MRVCGGALLSVAFMAREMVAATVTVSLPGMIRTGGMLRGGPFAGKTVISIVAFEILLPSETVKVILYCPTAVAMGVQLKFPVTWPTPVAVGKLAPIMQ